MLRISRTYRILFYVNLYTILISMGSSLIINININLTQRRSFKRCFDLLESKEMMTLDSHFEHLFLKKDLTHRGLGLIRCQTHKRLDLTHNRAQKNWVWQSVKLTDTWASRLAEFKEVGFGGVANP
jgi:hypothetical protein